MKRTVLFLLVGILIGSCGTNRSDMAIGDNPFFAEYNTPFDVPPFDRIVPEHFMPAFKEGMQRELEEIDNITGNGAAPDFQNTIVALDRTGRFLARVRDVFFNLSSANTNDEIQAISREISPLLAEHRDNINLNEKLFERVKAVYKEYEGRSAELNPEEQRLLHKTYNNFVRGGANLTGDAKERFRQINKELASLTNSFGENLLAETNDFRLIIEQESDLAGLPGYVVEMGAEDAKAAGLEGKWLYTLHKPSLIPFLQFSENRELRKKLYLGYINRGNNNNERDNKEIASQIAALRIERAHLLGYETHAHYVLDDNMAKKPENVYGLLDKVWTAALPVAKKEAAELQQQINAEGNTFSLESWDWWYYAEKLRKQRYDLNDEELKPYFELERVYMGMFEVANKLFGLSFGLRNDIPKPHPEAITYEVKEGDKHIAVLIMDFFPRPEKRGGAWMSSYRKQYRTDTESITPVVTIVMNFSKPAGELPSLLTFEEVSTMYHEFGHALHGMLSDCTYKLLSGTSVARDFVELPSQIMENWAAEPEVLKMYALHYQTGETIPANLIAKMIESSHFNQGFMVTEFTAAAYLDMAWHTLTEPTAMATMDFEDETLESIGLIPEIISRYRTPYFAHIFSGGYPAGYYSYQWAELLDADAFEAFRENGLFDRKTADAFKTNILSKGGTEDPMELYMRFRGKEPDPDAMLRRKGLIGS